MPEIYGDLRLVYNPYADRAHCLNNLTGSDLVFSVEQTIEQGKFIQDGDSLNLPLSYDECLNYNYLIAHIKARNGYYQLAYFFITSYDYKNAEVTAVTIELDTVETFLNFIDRCDGHLKRAHAPRLISRTNNPGYSETIVNPDLYYSEDDPSDNYQTERYELAKIGTTNLLLILNIPESMIIQPFTESSGEYVNDNEAYISCNPTNTHTYSTTPQTWSGEWLRSSFHQSNEWIYDPDASSGSLVQTGYSYSLRTYLNLSFDFTLRETSTSSTVNAPNHSTIALRTTDTGQLICVYLAFNDTSEITLLSTSASGGMASRHITFRNGLDVLLYLGPLLADKIVAAFPVPALNMPTSSPIGDGFINLTLKAGVCGVSCTSDGNEEETEDEEIYFAPQTFTLGTGYVITDLRNLSFSHYLNTQYLVSMINEAIDTYTGTSAGERSIYNEKKLYLYPYRFWGFNVMGCEVTYKLQDLAPVMWSDQWRTGTSTYSYELIMPYYLIDPLSSTPSIIGNYITSFLGVDGFGQAYDGDRRIWENLNAVLGGIVELFSDEPYSIFKNGWQILAPYAGIAYALQDDYIALVSVSDRVSYLPSYAVYQDSYQEYQNYSKALAVVNNEYSYQTAQIQKNQSITNGVLSILGGAASIGLGAAAGGLLGGSAIGSGAGNVASGVSNLIFSGQTYNAQTQYVYNAQQAQESSTAGKAPSQVSGNSQGTNLAYTVWNRFDKDSTERIQAVISQYSWPLRQLMIAEQKFYRWGYSIPEDVCLTDDTRLSAIPGWKQFFCYIQFDSVETLTFSDPDDNGRLLVPSIYQQDIADRLCKGITFINIRDAGTDCSSYTIDTTVDNYDAGTPDHALFNRWWVFTE